MNQKQIDEYKEVLKKRNYTLMAFNFALITANLIVNLLLKKPFFSGFVIGMNFSAIIIGIVLMLKNAYALKNEEKLKEFYIREKDERRKTIREKARSTTLLIVLAEIVLALCISGYFNAQVFFTLLGILFAMGITAVITKAVYNKVI